MITIYHNPKCRKSRAGLEFIKTKAADVEVVEYIREGITPETIRSLLNKLDLKPMELIRKQEEVYKSEIHNRDLPDDELIRLMAENPRLIRRPIIVNGNKAVVADPAYLGESVL